MRVSEKFALHADHTQPTKVMHAQMLATTIHKSNTTPHHQSRATTAPLTTHSGQRTNGLLPQSPIVCPMIFPTTLIPRSKPSLLKLHQTPTHYRCEAIFTNRLRSPNPHTMWAGRALVVLLRKEVIQPHLPVRLPCYDFVPIADPTFDGSLPQGVRPPASGVTDFHDVTGGVYKARERIHRSVADLRLLATPTSRGRVADPDPN